jgi:protein SCO1/2
MVACLLLLAAVIAIPHGAAAQKMMGDQGVPAEKLPPRLGDVNIEQKLNTQIPLQASFQDEFGRTVKLDSYFHQGKPVVLALVYYECPMLCTQVLNGLASTLRMMKLEMGKDYDVLTVSFDPREKPELAASKKRAYLQRYGHPNAQNYWHFLTGDEPNIRALTEAVGFHYQWDPTIQQYAHATGIMVLTPDGVLSKYFYGIEYSPKDLRLGLVDASENHIGTVVDRVLLYCYHYDPRTGKYGAVITNVIRVAGGLTVLILGTFVIILFKRGPSGRRSGSATLAEPEDAVLHTRPPASADVAHDGADRRG